MRCTIQIESIKRSKERQARIEMSAKVVDEYAEAYREGVEMPPPVVFFDGVHYHLADGFHRVAAAKKAKLSTIEVEQHDGTSRDATLYAIGANAAHGLRRTNKDKVRAIEMLLNDEEWSKWSNREIARRAKVSHQMVNKRRPTGVATVATPVPEVAADQPAEVDPIDQPGSPFAGLGEPAAPTPEVATVATEAPQSRSVEVATVATEEEPGPATGVATVATRPRMRADDVTNQVIVNALRAYNIELPIEALPAVIDDIRDSLASRATPRRKSTEPAFTMTDAPMPEWVEERARELQPLAHRIVRNTRSLRRDLNKFFTAAAEGVQAGQLPERRFVRLAYALEASNDADPVYNRPAPRVHRTGAGLGPLMRLQMALVAFLPLRACDRCNGTGEVNGEACGRCEGTGALGDESMTLPVGMG